MSAYILADVTLVIRDKKIISMIVPPEERGKLKGLQKPDGLAENFDVPEQVSVKHG